MSISKAVPMVLAVILLVSSMVFSQSAPDRSEIPDLYKWDTEHIYPTISAWEKDVEAIRKNIDRLAEFEGKFAADKANSAKNLIAFNKLSEETEARLERAYVYVYMNMHGDMSIGDWVGRNQQMQNLVIDEGQKLAWETPELLLIPRETMEEWIETYDELKPYRKPYMDMYDAQEHVLSPDEEELMALAGNITGSPSTIYRRLTDADMKFGFIIDENGDSVEVTDSNWNIFRLNPDRRVREDAFNAVWDEYWVLGSTMAELMAANIRKDIFISKARKYESTLEASLDPSNVPVSVYESLVKTTRDNLEPLHKYNIIRKRVLSVDNYRHWDYYVEIADVPDKRYTWEETVAMVSDGLKPLGEEYQNNVATALEPATGWVDVYANRGKRGGAYSTSCYGVHPYMLFNVDYEKGPGMEEIMTACHEVGHSLHTKYSTETQPFPIRDYEYFNAEVASTVNEIIFNKALLDKARQAYEEAETAVEAARSNPDRDAFMTANEKYETAKNELISLLVSNINDIRGAFFRQTLFAAWEWEAHKMGERGEPMTLESFNELYYNLLKEFHGPAAAYEEKSAISWARIPHFYRGYYVYTYATSYAAAVALASDILVEYNGDQSKVGAQERYLAYLHTGGSKDPVDLLRDAGVDMETPQPVEQLIAYFGGLVDELDVLTK